MRRTRLSSGFIGRLIIMVLAAALAAVILATTAFAQETTTPEPTSQPTATPTATQTPEPTSTPTPTPTPETTQSLPTAPPTTTQAPTPETTGATTPESTIEQTTHESTTGEPAGFASITVNPTQGPPGTTVTVTGSGWEDFAGEPVDIQTALVGDVPGVLESLPARVAAEPDNNGTFSISLTIPESAPPGREVKIMAILGNGGSVDASFTITQGDQGLEGSEQPSGAPSQGPKQLQQHPGTGTYQDDLPDKKTQPANKGRKVIVGIIQRPTGAPPEGSSCELAKTWWTDSSGRVWYQWAGWCWDDKTGWSPWKGGTFGPITTEALPYLAADTSGLSQGEIEAFRKYLPGGLDPTEIEALRTDLVEGEPTPPHPTQEIINRIIDELGDFAWDMGSAAACIGFKTCFHLDLLFINPCILESQITMECMRYWENFPGSGEGGRQI
jgi:hypothetical protein